MGVFILFILFAGIVVIFGKSRSSEKSNYHGGYTSNYYYDDDFEEYETAAARGKREYFSDDPARDYDSYYAQVADDAMMGDQDAIDEMRGEFGEGEG